MGIFDHNCLDNPNPNLLPLKSRQ